MPTAYEQACKALEKTKIENEKLKTEMKKRKNNIIDSLTKMDMIKAAQKGYQIAFDAECRDPNGIDDLVCFLGALQEVQKKVKEEG